MKQIFTLLILSALVLGGVAAINAPAQKERNLKVLPKDISDEKLDSIMHSYNIALGEKCTFCHVTVTYFTGKNDSLDYASDKEPMKESARNMIRMMIDINKNYFYFDKNMRPEYLHTVACMTCHRGNAEPQEK